MKPTNDMLVVRKGLERHLVARGELPSENKINELIALLLWLQPEPPYWVSEELCN